MTKAQTKRTQKPATRAARLKQQVVHKAKLGVVPHKKNQYRPHLVRRYGLAAAVFVALVGVFGYNIATSGQILGSKAQVDSQELLRETNIVRAEYGQGELQINQQLNQAATLKAQDMFAKQYWSHDAPDGTSPWAWFDEVGYNYAAAGENLAKNFTNSGAVVRAWLQSPSHRDNVLSENYQDIGFAVAHGELDGRYTSIVVALYGNEQVQGASLTATPPQQNLGYVGSEVGVLSRVGIAVQSLTPAAIGAITIFAALAVVALVAHAYRKRLPKPLRQTWYKHHGAIKAVGMASLIVIVLALYSGGQL